MSRRVHLSVELSGPLNINIAVTNWSHTEVRMPPLCWSHIICSTQMNIKKPWLGSLPAPLTPSLQTERRRSGFVRGGERYFGGFHGSWLPHTLQEAMQPTHCKPPLYSTATQWKASFYAHQVQASVAVSGQRSRMLKFLQLGFLCCWNNNGCFAAFMCTGDCTCENTFPKMSNWFRRDQSFY